MIQHNQYRNGVLFMSVRIMSLKLNKLILYGAAALAVLILILVLVTSLGRRSSPEGKNGAQYYPGVYSTSVSFGGQVLTIEMTFSETGITAVRCPIPDDFQSVYPLVEPTLSTIGSQLKNGTELEAVTVDSLALDTASYLKEAMALTLKKARRP